MITYPTKLNKWCIVLLMSPAVGSSSVLYLRVSSFGVFREPGESASSLGHDSTSSLFSNGKAQVLATSQNLFNFRRCINSNFSRIGRKWLFGRDILSPSPSPPMLSSSSFFITTSIIGHPNICRSFKIMWSGHLKGPFKEAIVFMIGGGNYVEYGSLQELAQRQQPSVKHVIYGTTEILTGGEFVEQLAVLGNKMGLGGGFAAASSS